MITKICRVALTAFLPLAILGCGNADNNSTQKVTAPPQLVEIDEDGQFETILNEVDKVAGNRFQSMQMEAMTSASYQYDGSIDEIVKVVEPIALKAGYSPMDSEMTEDAIAGGQEHIQEIANMEMDMIGTKMYQHKNGNLISISRMNISSDSPKMEMNMKLLTVQMMNPKKMSDEHSASKSTGTP